LFKPSGLVGVYVVNTSSDLPPPSSFLIFVVVSCLFGECLVGLKVNEARAAINGLKMKIEQIRIERANLGEGKENGGAMDEYDALEKQMQDNVHAQKIQYKSNFSELRSLKSEVERIQSKLKKQRMKMQKEFELWYGTMLRNSKEGHLNSEDYHDGHGGGGGKTQEYRPDQGSSKQQDAPANQFLTGDQDVDRDILQFFAAKKALLKRA